MNFSVRSDVSPEFPNRFQQLALLLAIVESGRFRGVRGKTWGKTYHITGAGKLRAWLNLPHHLLRIYQLLVVLRGVSPLVLRQIARGQR